MDTIESNISILQAKTAMSDFAKALEFVTKRHALDLERMNSKNSIIQDFDSFLIEYVYIVVSVGSDNWLKNATTASLILQSITNMEKVREICQNTKISKAIEAFLQKRGQWSLFIQNITTVDSLKVLPLIDDLNKNHFARNLGFPVSANPSKQELQWCQSILGKADIQSFESLINDISKRTHKKPGIIQFTIWIWLIHSKTPQNCCTSGLALH